MLRFGLCLLVFTNLAAADLYQDVSKTHIVSSKIGQNSMDGEAVDVDGDGDLDMVIAIEFRPNLLLMNDGTGKLVDESDQRLPRTNHDSEDIAVADFDQDGDMDLVIVSEDDRQNEYYENDGKGFFVARGDRFPDHKISNVVQTFDVNGDDLPDLVIGNAGNNQLLVNNGKGYFRDVSQLLPNAASVTQDIAIGDLDGDGDLDLVEGNETENRILLFNPQRGFEVHPNALPNNQGQTRDVDLADVDADGDLDLLVANVDFGDQGNPRNQLLLNDGASNFSLANVAFNRNRTVDAAFVDIDGDGDLDILSGNRWDGASQHLFVQQKNRSWIEAEDLLPEGSEYTFDFNFADFNGDGLLDVYLCNFRGADRLWFGQSEP